MRRTLALACAFTLALGLFATQRPAPVNAATGDLVHSVTFSTDCGLGVGIAFDGSKLWYSCYLFGGGSPNLFRADALSGVVDAAFTVPIDGLGALSYDGTRNAIWAGGGPDGVYRIDLDASKNVVATSLAFNTGDVCGLDDGLAFDARNVGDPTDDVFYYSDDCFTTTIVAYDLSGSPVESFATCATGGHNSGLAVGGQLLFQADLFNNSTCVVDKTTKALAFSYPTAVAGDPSFHAEDMECDTTTFASSGKHVMWSKEAFSPARAHAFEIPFNTCGSGGQPPEPEGRLQVNKFYDLNANGVNDGEAAIAGWQVRIHDGFDIFENTLVDLVVDPDDYTVTESAPVQPNWIPTTATSVNVTVDAGETEVVEFGNVCLGAGGGKTLGFWSNKNGKAVMNDGGSLNPELALLSSLNLRNDDGTNFDPATYDQFRSWLLSANGANMAHMLSAQLAAMALNVEAGFVNPAALIYAPGTLSANPLGFASVGAVMAEADALLGADGLIPDGDPLWARAVALKNALDRANNNLNFVQSSPCAFAFAPHDRIIDADGVASSGDGIPAAVDVAVGNALHSFPVTVSNNSGLDMFDNDANGAWTFGPAGDDLMTEGTAFCPGGLRNAQYDDGFDCVVLDYDTSLVNGQPVNCDLEFLIAFTACPANVTFHDMDLDGAWDTGEDIVLDVNANGIYD